MKYIRIPLLEFIPALAVMAVSLLVIAWVDRLPWTLIPLGVAFYAFACVAWRVDNGDAPLMIPVPSRRGRK